MQPTIDLYLGTFLVLSGFAMSLLNLRRIVKNSALFARVLISENIFLTCVGIAFISRSVYHINTMNVNMVKFKERMGKLMVYGETKNCNIWFVLISYGPFIVSLVNSFLTLIIDNYLHYKMLLKIKEKEDENTVQEIGEVASALRRINVKKISMFWRKYFSFVAIAVQWIIPFIMVLPMYAMGVQETNVSVRNIRSLSDSCMAMLELTNDTCSGMNIENITVELRKYINAADYLDDYENKLNKDNLTSIRDSVVNNVFNIISQIQNKTKIFELNVTSPYLFRKPKLNDDSCLKMCYVENKKLILYMFLLAVVSFFAPITISTMILTKIHVMDVNKPAIKTYVSRELLYNILFWTPTIFDTMFSLILCSYELNGMRTSFFNAVANVYQAVKNFMNTKYFKENSVQPV